MEITEEEKKEFEKEIESILNRSPKEVTEEDIKKGFDLKLKREFNFTDEKIKLIHQMAQENRSSIANLQRSFGLGYRKAATIFDYLIYFYSPQLIKNIDKALKNKIFNIKEIVFMTIGEFTQLYKIGNLFGICENIKDNHEFMVTDTIKFRALCDIILGLDYKLAFREKFSEIDCI